ncbi:MAG: hypothetical protein ABJD07_03475 [Gemmatimonadaceae bacterium]
MRQQAEAGTREQAREAAQQARDAMREARDQAREAAREAIRAQVPTPAPRPGGQGGTIQLPPNFPTDVPPHVYSLASGFLAAATIMVIGLPIARAIARWIDRRGRIAPASGASPELAAQIQRIEHGIEAVAIEVERISEGQRFLTQLNAGSRTTVER